MQHNRSRANHRGLANPHGSEQDGAGTDLHAIFNNRTPAVASPLTDGHTMTKRAAPTNHRLPMHHQPDAVPQTKPRAHRRLVVEFDSQQPVDQQHVSRQNRQPQNPDPGRKPSDQLACPEKDHHEAAFRAAGICGPVLKNVRNHLAGWKMSIAFYIPKPYLPSADQQASWTTGGTPKLLGGGKAASAQSWIYQTWMELRTTCPVELVTQLPEKGIIITLSNLLHEDFRANPEQFVVAAAADFLPHPGAHLQILQNPAHARRLPGAIFVPHWPQPGLFPRDPTRGQTVERAAFFGAPSNLAPQLAEPDFQRHLLRETGVQLELRQSSKWHDYSDVDVVIAIRDFSRARHLSKPATKLYNAWLANAPLIGGSDSAFQAEGNPGTDFLIATSPKELLQQIRELKDNPSKWQAIAGAGIVRSATRSRNAIRAIWQHLCETEIPRRFEAWNTRSHWEQYALWRAKRALYFLDRKCRS